ncbi:Insect odorant-binding protein A10/Ejaculatory bulb-specific protein 3 [Trinorchestia longiramus]|nr:Insect odorant-binding protein A10/Ejaculatory bulb-specific protein 3 [Trinorchestia longiramus]
MGIIYIFTSHETSHTLLCNSSDNMSRTLQVTALVFVLTALATALPQSAQQPSQRQGQSISTKTEGDFNELAPDTRLSQITNQDFDEFFANAESVNGFTECLVNPKTCTSASGRNLVKQITSLKSKGQCDDCDAAEQTRLNESIYYFIKSYREKYPEQWDRILPRVIHIISEA